MKKKDFLLSLEEIVEVDPNTLTGSEDLEELEGWDSLGVVGFIAMIDENFEITLPARKISNCRTVDDLVALLGTKVST
ncbi:acyl carrier protein [Anthocerotibacter panamensis]|uniref:acyl carrier protein n=1 Tax=Anthocerotibacter panamensis TaxID=2857077 RepID=UPI001C40193B|nr:acyl carrier protein [Anthocerotibacter panamensis]